MRILVFTESTTIDYIRRIPCGNAVAKLRTWMDQGAEISYLTSRRKSEEISLVRQLLEQFNFPPGELFYRREGEKYKDVAERVLPDLLVEDDCASIGGQIEMTWPHIKPELRTRIKSIVVKEDGGIDHLPDRLIDLMQY